MSVPGVQVDRRCGSGLQAIVNAAMLVQTGASDVVLAGGVDSMSQVEYYTTAMRWGARSQDATLYDRLNRARATAGGKNYPVPGGMVETAENLRREYGISRQEQDELALHSHERAVAAQAQGLFDEEIVPVMTRQNRTEVLVDKDEHPRADTSLESLGRLRPMLLEQDPEATVTAGNASGQNDAAAVCIVTSPERASELGLVPMLRLRSWALGAVEPARMGIAPVIATARALERADVKLADIDLIELNEAFAAQVLACTREWGFTASDFERLNVQGSGISLGHPIGATGGRILATLAYAMRRRGAALGLEAMCIGGGQGIAAIFELVS